MMNRFTNNATLSHNGAALSHAQDEIAATADVTADSAVAAPHPSDPPAVRSPDMLQQLVAGTVGPLSRLRDAVNLTLDQVADWISQPENRSRVANLVTLLDAQTQLLMCQHRLLAVARLVEVAAGQASPEVIRRACCDLLKFRLFDPYREDKRPLSAVKPTDPAPSEEAILAALQSIGETEERVMRDMMSSRATVASNGATIAVPPQASRP